MVGGFLVAVAAVGLFAAYARAADRDRARYVVASHDIGVGSRIAAGDLALEAMRLPKATQRSAFSDPSGVVGRLVVGPLARGELVQAASVLARDRTPPFREVVLRVDAPQVGAVTEGDTVDVLVSTGSAETTTTEVVVGGVRVLRLADRARGIGSDGKQDVAFAVSSFDEARLLVEASRAGSLTLVRSTGFPPQAGTFVHAGTPKAPARS
jgi:Flp pilus assembly protein CpaB